MRTLPVFILALALTACESKKPAETPAEDEFPPVPTMTAQPGSTPAPKTAPEPVIEPPELPPPVEEVREAAPPTDDEAEPPAKKSGARRSGMGDGGSGSGGSVGQLLEASAPGGWKVDLVSTDGDNDATKRALGQRQKAFDRCLAFLDKDTNALRATVTLSGGTASKVASVPANDTTTECLRAQLGNVQFPNATTMVLQFRR